MFKNPLWKCGEKWGKKVFRDDFKPLIWKTSVRSAVTIHLLTNDASKSVVLNLFYISYPFIKQDHQIYPQCAQCCLFLKNTKSKSPTVRIIYKNYICYNLWFSKFTPVEDQIYPRLRTTGLSLSVACVFEEALPFLAFETSWKD